MSVFFCINRARAAAGPLRRSRAGGMDCSEKYNFDAGKFLQIRCRHTVSRAAYF